MLSSSRFGTNTSPRYRPGTTVKPWIASNSKHEAPFGTPRTTILARPSVFAPLCIIACLKAPSVIHKCFRRFLALSRNKSKRSKRRPNATFNGDTRGRFGAHLSSPETTHYRSAKKSLRRDDQFVSFVDAFMLPLLEATSRLLHRICSLAFPQAFSKGYVYELLRQVRDFFEFGTAEPLHCRNQDLAGFFNSISQYYTPWRITLEFYRQRHGAQADTTFSVNLKEQAQQLRVFRGRRRTRASREVIIWCEDIPTIIRHALALQHFQVSTRNFRQCFGSPMGSPALARFMRDGHCRAGGNLAAHIQH